MDTESVRRWWDYTLAYRRMIEATHMSWAPWHIVPANRKWFRDHVVARIDRAVAADHRGPD